MKRVTLSLILLFIIFFASTVICAQGSAQQKAPEEATAKEKLPAQLPVTGQGPGENTAEQAPEPVKIQVTVSQQVIDQQMTAYKGNLKEIVKDAERNLKKIDGEIKSGEDEKAVTEHLGAADTLSAEGKYKEAKDEYQAALEAASTPEVKRKIKDKKRVVDQKVKQEESRAGQAARAIEKAQQKSKRQTEQREPEAKKDLVKKTVLDQVQQRPAPQKHEQKRAPVKTGVRQNFSQKNLSAKAKSPQAAGTVSAERSEAEAQARIEAQKAAEKRAAEEAAQKAEQAAEKRAVEEAAQKAEQAAEKKITEEATAKAQAEAAAKMHEAAQKEVGQVVASQTAAQAVTAKAPAEEDAVSAMYKEAVALYWDSKYNEARAKFEEVQKISPEYSRTNYYLGRIKEKLAK